MKRSRIVMKMPIETTAMVRPTAGAAVETLTSVRGMVDVEVPRPRALRIFTSLTPGETTVADTRLPEPGFARGAGLVVE
jgi:hypothetical protein